MTVEDVSMTDAGISDTVSMMYEAASGSVSRVSGSVSLTDEGASTATVYPWPRSSLVYPEKLQNSKSDHSLWNLKPNIEYNFCAMSTRYPQRWMPPPLMFLGCEGKKA